MWPVPGRGRGRLPGSGGPGGPPALSRLHVSRGPWRWRRAVSNMHGRGQEQHPGRPWRVWGGSRRAPEDRLGGHVLSPLPSQSLNTPEGQYRCKQHPNILMVPDPSLQSQGGDRGHRKGLFAGQREVRCRWAAWTAGRKGSAPSPLFPDRATPTQDSLLPGPRPQVGVRPCGHWAAPGRTSTGAKGTVKSPP